MAATPLASPGDVAAIWHSPLTAPEIEQVTRLIARASAKLRRACPFNIDDGIAQFQADMTPVPPTALDPLIVADVVATIVKRFLVNTDGVATSSETIGPYSHSATFVNRYDKTGSDVRGAIQVTDSDIDQLRAPVPFTPGFTIHTEPKPLHRRRERYFGRHAGVPFCPDELADRGFE